MCLNNGERKSCGFRTTQVNVRIMIVRWTVPLCMTVLNCWRSLILNRLFQADILKERERLHSEQEMRCELMKSSNRVFIWESVVLQMWFCSYYLHMCYLNFTPLEWVIINNVNIGSYVFSCEVLWKAALFPLTEHLCWKEAISFTWRKKKYKD